MTTNAHCVAPGRGQSSVATAMRVQSKGRVEVTAQRPDEPPISFMRGNVGQKHKMMTMQGVAPESKGGPAEATTSTCPVVALVDVKIQRPEQPRYLSRRDTGTRL